MAVANVIVMAVSSDQKYGWSGITDLNGNYLIATNLATGTYNVTAFLPEGYVGKTLSGVEVTEGVETTGVDLALKPSGVISGTVTAMDGTPLVNATVTVSSEDGEYYGFATTDVSGNYRMSSGLGTGMYMVFAMYEMGFAQVSDVDVVAGEETSGVDLVIDVPPPTPTGGISGEVTDSEGNPIEGAIVTASGPAGYGSARTDENGNYLISEGLGTGAYTVEASAVGFVSRSTTDVEVEVGKETENVNFELERIPPEESGIISGTVLGDENPIVELEESSITCTLSQQTITVGSSVTVSGAISPGLSTQVTIQVSEDGGDTWTTLTTVTSASDGTYSHEWTPTEVGSYQVKASWLGDEHHFGDISSSISLNVTKVTKISSEISSSVSPQEIKQDESITVSGSITPAIGGVTVTLTHKKPDGSTHNRTVTTGSDGSYSDSFKPDATGSWSITASWEGNSTYEGASSSSKSFTVKKSGCLIATATYGSELSPNVQFLRSFRDNTVLTTFAGSNFMTVFNGFYYSFSPSVASVISGNEVLRGLMKIVLYPLMGILHLSSAVFSLFSFSPELGVVIAGLVASALIGVVYFLPPVLILGLIKKFKVSVKVIRLTSLVWAGSVMAIIVAELSKSPLIMMMSTGAFVLATISVATLTSLRIVSKHPTQ